MRHLFTVFAKHITDFTGRPLAFVLAFITVIVWAVTGPLFGYSETWQLVINTGTTIVTFLMVFLIQNAQNRDTQALHIKLDELIRVTEGAHTALLDLEELDEEQLCKIKDTYEEIAKESRKAMESGSGDTHVPHIEIPSDKAAKPRRTPRRKQS